MRRVWFQTSISEKGVRQRIDRYIKYYNEERIQEKLGYHAPKTFDSMSAIRVFYLCLILLFQSK
ncbi:IS3 family transposase [Bacillus safensis]|uniref:IS3 family transposase n=1 Tax=Bacillus safensis TaxID=561879 RepID=A0AC61ZXG3_BACIA